MQVVGFEAYACSIKRDPKRPIEDLSCFRDGNPNGKLPDRQPVEKGKKRRVKDLLEAIHAQGGTACMSDSGSPACLMS